MGKYLSIDECPGGDEARLFYTANRREETLNSANPLLVKTGKVVPPSVTVFIDDSGSMNDIVDEIVTAIENEISSSVNILYPGDERWLSWIEQALSPVSESLALIFIDESSYYLYPPHWQEDLASFLANWKETPKSYAHVFVVNDEGDYSSKLAMQVTDAFSQLKATGYSFSINSPASIATSPPRGNRGTGTSVSPQKTQENPVAIKGPIGRFLSTIKGGYQIEVFASYSFNKEAILSMKANNQPIPDWMFHGPILTEKSDSEINISFGCNGRCSTDSFELESNYPPGYECFPYQVAIDWLEEMDRSFFKILRIL